MKSSYLLKCTLILVPILIVAGVLLYVLYGTTSSSEDVVSPPTTPQEEVEQETIATSSEVTDSVASRSVLSVVNEGCVDGWCRYSVDEKYEVEAPEGFKILRDSAGRSSITFEKELEVENVRTKPYGDISISFPKNPLPFDEWYGEPTVLVEPVEINGDTWYGGNATIVPCGTYLYYRGSFFVSRVMFTNCMPDEVYYDESISPKFLHEHTDLVERVLGSIREI